MLGLRVTPEMKRRLDAAAEQSGRSQSQEAEFRLERSFDRTDLLSEVLALEFGKELAGVLLFLGNTMIWSDAFHPRQVDNNHPPTKWTWARDADGYDQAVQGAVAVLEAMRPAEPVKAQSSAGVEMANTIIKAVRADPDAANSGFTDGAPTIRALLGPLVERLRTEKPRNPFRLAVAVFMASKALEQVPIRGTASRVTIPQDKVVEILEANLRDYLATDWQQRGWRDEGQHSETGQEELALEIRRRA